MATEANDSCATLLNHWSNISDFRFIVDIEEQQFEPTLLLNTSGAITSARTDVALKQQSTIAGTTQAVENQPDFCVNSGSIADYNDGNVELTAEFLAACMLNRSLRSFRTQYNVNGHRELTRSGTASDETVSVTEPFSYANIELAKYETNETRQRQCSTLQTSQTNPELTVINAQYELTV